jgi:hypothetical protein
LIDTEAFFLHSTTRRFAESAERRFLCVTP